jgi:hypothetical protein
MRWKAWSLLGSLALCLCLAGCGSQGVKGRNLGKDVPRPPDEEKAVEKK